MPFAADRNRKIDESLSIHGSAMVRLRASLLPCSCKSIDKYHRDKPCLNPVELEVVWRWRCDLFLVATVAPGPININKSPDNTPALKELPCDYARAILDA